MAVHDTVSTHRVHFLGGGAIGNGSTVTSASLDSKDGRFARIVIGYSTLPSVTVVHTLHDSSDDSTFAAVSGVATISFVGGTDTTGKSGSKVFNVDMQRTRRYVRISSTQTGVGTAVHSVAAVQGPSAQPISASSTSVSVLAATYDGSGGISTEEAESLEGLGESVFTAPTVTTEAATDVADTTATINGTVDNDGMSGCWAYFEYGETAAYELGQTALQAVVAGADAQAVEADLTGLTAETEYHFRCVAYTAAGTDYGDDTTLTTTA